MLTERKCFKKRKKFLWRLGQIVNEFKNGIHSINRDEAFEEKVRYKDKKKIRKKRREKKHRNENGLSYYEKLDRLIALRKRHKW